jgi:hypothetical protein
MVKEKQAEEMGLPILQYSNTPTNFNSFMEVFLCCCRKSKNITEN